MNFYKDWLRAKNLYNVYVHAHTHVHIHTCLHIYIRIKMYFLRVPVQSQRILFFIFFTYLGMKNIFNAYCVPISKKNLFTTFITYTVYYDNDTNPHQ